MAMSVSRDGWMGKGQAIPNPFKSEVHMHPGLCLEHPLPAPIGILTLLHLADWTASEFLNQTHDLTGIQRHGISADWNGETIDACFNSLELGYLFLTRSSISYLSTHVLRDSWQVMKCPSYS